MKYLYMFAIMPPDELSAKIHNERVLFSEKYKSNKALKPPVHITLYPPFWEQNDFEDKAEALRGWAALQYPFAVELKDYNYFNNPRSPVVYIDVVKNPVLTDFHNEFVKQLQKLMETEESKTYKPHFTLGYRDVPPSLFPEIVEEYSKRTFRGSFGVHSIFLWKHDRKKWNILREFELRSVE